MNIPESSKKNLSENGFVILDDIYTDTEIAALLHAIESADTDRASFRKSKDLFAIRRFLKEMPDTFNLIFNKKLRAIISVFFGDGYFVTKSIYFDKPGQSNWFVAYHQDLIISVNKKADLEGYGSWTVKQGEFAVQPPTAILENNFTIRIHLDNTDERNGALKVIPTSHLKKIYRPETIDWHSEREVTCAVKKGGIMIMRPLLLHASGKTKNNAERRVIHIEFSNQSLADSLEWSEKISL